MLGGFDGVNVRVRIHIECVPAFLDRAHELIQRERKTGVGTHTHTRKEKDSGSTRGRDTQGRKKKWDIRVEPNRVPSGFPMGFHWVYAVHMRRDYKRDDYRRRIRRGRERKKRRWREKDKHLESLEQTKCREIRSEREQKSHKRHTKTRTHCQIETHWVTH